jgi:hypothetical protein
MLSTKSKPELAVYWQSFASQTTAVSRGTTFPADDPVVKQYAEHFVSAEIPESQWPRANWIVPEREPTGRVKLRVLPVAGERKNSALVWHRGTEYYANDTLKAEGRDAEHLLDVGVCEIVKKLPPNEEAA